MGAFIVSEGVKTLSHLNRQGLVPQDLYAVADFFTSSPWQAEAVRQALLRFLVHQAIESAQHSSAVGPRYWISAWMML